MLFLNKLTVIWFVNYGVMGYPEKHTIDHESLQMPAVNGEDMLNHGSQEDSKMEIEPNKRSADGAKDQVFENTTVLHTQDNDAVEVLAIVENNSFKAEAEVRIKRIEPHAKSRKHKMLKKLSASDSTKSQEPVHAASNDANLKAEGSSQTPQTTLTDSPAIADPRDIAEALHAHTYTSGSRIHGTKVHEHENRYGGRSTLNGGITHPLASPNKFGG